MPDLTWKPCEHDRWVPIRGELGWTYPRRAVCLHCGKPVLVYEDGTIREEVRGL